MGGMGKTTVMKLLNNQNSESPRI
ncbi:hypothetical protein CKAN_02754900 [Cinnamomum micranthum f. kanehirae]|uniref:Uncharacterized protein n=1 Tax=Cinnamomum micranthum f. kanehirae TaxID=337451 RepID=A0A443Q4Y8_9MAGN|nr:hypothetical protein CKAN_02754900 [Cinnamomum micranthum f. kanehirae]